MIEIIKKYQNNKEQLRGYLDNSGTLAKISEMEKEDQLAITNILYKENMFVAHIALNTQVGLFLAKQPTTDQTLIGVIGIVAEALISKDKRDGLRIACKLVNKFRLSKASHLPEYVALEFYKQCNPQYFEKTYYGEASKPDKHIARRCMVCHVARTNQQDSEKKEEHMSSFHKFKPLPLDDSKTAYVYKKELTDLLCQKGEHSPEIKRLMPGALYKQNGHDILYFPDLGQASLLLPEAFLTPGMCKKIFLCQQYHADNFIRELNTHPVHKVITSDVKKKIIRCHKSMVKFSLQIPFLAALGSELKKLYNKKNHKPMKMERVTDYYLVGCHSMASFKSDQDCEWLQWNHELLGILSLQGLESIDTVSPDSFEAASNVTKKLKSHQHLTRPKEGNYIFIKDEIRGILREALNNLSKNNLQPGSAPVYIGYVPGRIAKTVANKGGFLDSNWSLNLLHGKYPYIMALTYLSRVADLDEKILGVILDYGLWNDILDFNALKTRSAHLNYSDAKLPFLVVHIGNAIISCSPFRYQQLLSTGQLSAALEDIQQAIELHDEKQQGTLLELFAKHMGMNQLSMEQLKEMTGNINALEMVISTKHMRSVEQIKKAHPELAPEIKGVGLYGDIDSWRQEGLGDFQAGPRIKSVIASKANKYFLKRGYTLNGINSDTSPPRLIRINNATDIQQCDSFIAYSPFSPLAATVQALPEA